MACEATEGEHFGISQRNQEGEAHPKRLNDSESYRMKLQLKKVTPLSKLPRGSQFGEIATLSLMLSASCPMSWSVGVRPMRVCPTTLSSRQGGHRPLIRPIMARRIEIDRLEPPFEEAEGEWVLRKDFRGLKSFGWFQCPKCSKRWVSSLPIRGRNG